MARGPRSTPPSARAGRARTRRTCCSGSSAGSRRPTSTTTRRPRRRSRCCSRSIRAILSYRLSTKATFVFEDVRRRLERRAPPAIDVRWRGGQKVGDRIPLDLEVVADPKALLRRATLFVRERGEPAWRAADVDLPDAPAAGGRTSSCRRCARPGRSRSSSTCARTMTAATRCSRGPIPGAARDPAALRPAAAVVPQALGVDQRRRRARRGHRARGLRDRRRAAGQGVGLGDREVSGAPARGRTGGGTCATTRGCGR